jgi:hypothetical protein
MNDLEQENKRLRDRIAELEAQFAVLAERVAARLEQAGQTYAAGLIRAVFIDRTLM